MLSRRSQLPAIGAIWAHMKSRWWGKLALGVAVLSVLGTPAILLKVHREQSAAVALVSRADSGGPVLIPARCDVPGAELERDYVVVDGKALKGRASRRACFYTISAFRRLFPERYRNDDPATFRVQQITTGTRLLAPSYSNVRRLAIGAALSPFFVVGLAMVKAATDIMAARARADRDGHRHV
jgi:hypothetical protein